MFSKNIPSDLYEQQLARKKASISSDASPLHLRNATFLNFSNDLLRVSTFLFLVFQQDARSLWGEKKIEYLFRGTSEKWSPKKTNLYHLWRHN